MRLRSVRHGITIADWPIGKALTPHRQISSFELFSIPSPLSRATGKQSKSALQQPPDFHQSTYCFAPRISISKSEISQDGKNNSLSMLRDGFWSVTMENREERHRHLKVAHSNVDNPSRIARGSFFSASTARHRLKKTDQSHRCR